MVRNVIVDKVDVNRRERHNGMSPLQVILPPFLPLFLPHEFFCSNWAGKSKVTSGMGHVQGQSRQRHWDRNMTVAGEHRIARDIRKCAPAD